jgi:glycosyltransferase involved in cell wall biosynthesis
VDISIVTVVKNDQDGLMRTIESVSQQVGIGIEHIVVDGGSIDGSRELALQHSHIQVQSMLDGGLYFGMQRGLNVANGFYVMFLNSGDVLLGTNNLSQAVMLLSASDSDWGFGPIVEKTKRNTLVFTPTVGQLTTKAIAWRETYVPFPTTIARRSLLKSIGSFETRFRIAADFHLVVKLALTATPTRWDIPIVIFGAGGVSYSQAPLAWKEEHFIRKELLKLNSALSLVSFLKVRLRIIQWYAGKLLDLAQDWQLLGSSHWRDRRAKKWQISSF